MPNAVDHRPSPLEDRCGDFPRRDARRSRNYRVYGEVQVLSEYPEVRMNEEEQGASSGETYSELEKRLDAALNSFEEGPPFTLQRLCEILLAARTIYLKVSKLALALEKNLLVTSTLSMCTDQSPQSLQKLDESEKLSEEPEHPSSSVENGVQPMAGDKDEVMTEVEEAEIDDVVTVDMEAFEDKVRSSETNSTLAGSS